MVLMFGSSWKVWRIGKTCSDIRSRAEEIPLLRSEHVIPRVSDRVSPCLLDTANTDLLKILRYGDSKYRNQSICDLTCFDVVRNALPTRCLWSFTSFSRSPSQTLDGDIKLSTIFWFHSFTYTLQQWGKLARALRNYQRNDFWGDKLRHLYYSRKADPRIL